MIPRKKMHSVESWDKMARSAQWVGGVAQHITPGSKEAVSKLRHGPKYKARGKKVIRPRINKHPHSEEKGSR